MATAKLMKNVKPSPPSSSSSSPSSFTDERSYANTTSLASDDDDLEDVVHSILMLIVEGRMTAKSKHGITTREGAHATQLIDKLTTKLIHLSTNEQQQYGGGKHFKLGNANLMLNTSVKMMTMTKNEAAMNNTSHVCSTRHFIQCQIASKLKHKLIEKCMLEHQSLLKKRINNNQHQPQRSQIQHSQIQEKLYLAKYQLLKPNHYNNINNNNNNPSSSLTQALPVPSSTQFSSLVSSESANSYLELDTTYLNTLPCIISTNTIIQIDVILLDNCCFADIISKFGDNIILLNDNNENLETLYTYDLLERWNISMISTSNLNRNNDNSTATTTTTATIAKSLLSINELFQAIRSYLHFSQISSWINQTKGEQPKNIAFTLKYTTESKEVVDSNNEVIVETNESAHTSLNEASSNESSSFDYQTFPTLSLLFANKKFYLNNNYSSNLTNQNKQSALSTILKINLQSRKRSTLAASATTTESASSSSSLSSINAINSGLIVLAGIPQIICNKLHSNTNNTVSLGKNSPPSHHLPIIVRNFYKHLNTMSNNHSNNEANNNNNLIAINNNMNSYYSHQNELLLTPMSLLNSYKSSSTLALTPPTTPTPPTGSIHFKPFENLRHLSSPSDTLSEVSVEFDSNLDTSQSPKVLVSNILTTISNLNDSMSTNLCIACNNINQENGLIEERSNHDESQFKHVESSTASFSSSSTCKLITSPIDNVRISLFKKCIKESEKEADVSLKREENNDEQKVIENLSNEYDCESDANGFQTSNNQCKYVNFNYNSSLSKIRRNSNGGMNNSSIYINNVNKSTATTAVTTNFPLSSSPAPMRKSGALQFDFDQSLKNPRSIKNALSANLITKHPADEESTDNNNNSNIETNNELAESTNIKERSNEIKKYLNNLNKSIKMQLSFSNRNISLERQTSGLGGCLTPNCLLGSFEESLLNGRMNPVGVVDGFYAEIGASGSFFPEHVVLPVYAAFYQVCEDIAASPYLGVINLASLANNGSSAGSKRGYRVPNKGTIQVTLFNPNKTVVKMFVVMYDLSDMPPNHRTFIRQRTMYVPLHQPTSATSHADETISSNATTSFMSKSFLRYLIHLRFATSKSGKMYLHTNIKLIFARNKSEIDPRLGRYEYKTFTELPKNPRYSLKK